MPNTLRDRVERVSRDVLEAMPNFLQDPMRRYAGRGLKAVTMPFMMIGQLLGVRAQPRIAFLCSTPTVPQVVTNYTRGLTLFGRSRAHLAIFEWRSFPFRAVITRETAKVPKSLAPFSGVQK
jgi:hypothetical protein